MDDILTWKLLFIWYEINTSCALSLVQRHTFSRMSLKRYNYRN